MTENIIFKKILTDKEFFSNVYGNLKPTDFLDKESKFLLKSIGELYQKYNKVPNESELSLYVDNSEINIKDKIVYRNKLEEIKETDTNLEKEIIIDATEKYIKRVRTEELLLLGADMLEGNSKETSESIQKKFEEINKLSFKKTSGLDYIKDAEANFLEYGKAEENGIKSHLDLINISTGGGWKKQTLSLICAETNSGKTSIMVNIGAEAMKQGKNVAFFTFEESEIAIRSRFDSTIFQKPSDELKELNVSLATTFNHIVNKGLGDLKIKAYGARSASCIDVQGMLDEWKLKGNFIPDILILDSVNIIAPSVKSDNLYSTGKATTEEMKALSNINDIPVISALQFGRSGFGTTEAGITDISESIASGQISDNLLALLRDEHRPEVRILSCLKSRATNKDKLKPVVINFFSDTQTFKDLEGETKYIKSSERKELEVLNTIVDNTEKLEDGESVLSTLFGS